MLTLAYCSSSRNKTLEEKLIKTSGLKEIEVLYIDEFHHSKGYNKALKKAKGEIVVFIREEVEIHSDNWGKKVVEAFEKSDFAVLGTVGSISVPMTGMIWEKEQPLVGRMWYEKFDSKHEERFSEIFRGKVIPVSVLEGSFIACHKERLKHHFDEKYLGDSFYETDFCVSNHKDGASVGVFFDVKILKLTFDDQDDDFIKNQKYFVSRHKEHLPFRIKPEIMYTDEKVRLKDSPAIGVMILNRGKPVELFSCLESIYEKSTYPNLKIFVIDLGSTEEELDAMDKFIAAHEDTTLLQVESEHIPSIFNGVVKSLSKEIELLLFCDREIVLINDAISRMVKVYQENKSECGTIGARIHNRNHMIRHFGIEIFSTEAEDGYELGLGYQGYQYAYRYRNQLMKNVLGSSKEMLMVSRELFLEVGGFNGDYYYSLFDYELNLKSILAGKKNFLVGTAACYYLGRETPKFLPEDFSRLVEFVNENSERVLPYVNLCDIA